MDQNIDPRLMDDLRAAASLSELQPLLARFASRFDFNGIHYVNMTTRDPRQVLLHATPTAGYDRLRQSLARVATPLIEFCHRRLSPLIWQSDENQKHIEIVEKITAPGVPYLCGVSVPVHGPNDTLGVLTVASLCGRQTTCASEHLSTIHSMAILVHAAAMRNCDSTRFGLHYETVDASFLPKGVGRSGNVVSTPILH